MSSTSHLPDRSGEGGSGPLPAPGPDGLRPAQRVVVLVVVTIVIVGLCSAGRSPSEVIGLMLLGTTVADQVCRWLSGKAVTTGV